MNRYFARCDKIVGHLNCESSAGSTSVKTTNGEAGLILKTTQPGRFVDLSRPLHHRTLAHPNHVPVLVGIDSDHDLVTYPLQKPSRSGRMEFSSKRLYISMGDHSGTHVDAPMHFDPDSDVSIDKIPLQNFYTEAICLDLSHVGLKHEITIAELEAALEKSGQVILPGDTVLIHMGLNDRLEGQKAWQHDFSGLHLDAVHWLADKGIRMFGVEAVSPAIEGESNFQAHIACAERGITHMEAMCNLDQVVGKGRFIFIGFPIKLVGGTGGPMRAVAFFPEENENKSVRRHFVDLSRPIHHDMLVHPNHAPVVMGTWYDHQTRSTPLSKPSRTGRTSFTSKALHISMGDHSGTHVDAPMHFDPNSDISIEKLPLENFHSSAICLDLSHVGLKHDITVEEMEEALRKSGEEIRVGDTVLIHMGLNQRLEGQKAWQHDFSGLHIDAVHWLADKGIRMFGVEAVSPGTEGEGNWQAHIACAERGITHMEALCNLEKVAGKGRFTFIGFPLKIQGGTGGPMRAVAVFDV